MSDCVVDASALLAVVLSEPDAARYATALLAPGRRLVSAATLLEAAIASERRHGLEGRERLDVLLRRLEPELVPFTEEHLGWARDAYRRFGKGRHPAALNMGDCITYATARHAALPLLFKGDDFAQTDLDQAQLQ
jgi:ribonuclease VapC